MSGKYIVAAVSKVFTTTTYHKTDTIDCTKPGYKAIGIVGHNQDSGANYTFARLYLSGNIATVTIAETEKSVWYNGKMTVYLYILYEKI